MLHKEFYKFFCYILVISIDIKSEKDNIIGDKTGRIITSIFSKNRMIRIDAKNTATFYPEINSFVPQ